MGYFDDDDDDDEEEEQRRSRTSLAASSTKSATGKDEDEEDDPLDAFMNSLQADANKTSSQKRTRLDLENEEEATSHWEETAVEKDAGDSMAEQRALAREQFRSNFIKASASPNEKKLPLKRPPGERVFSPSNHKFLASWPQNTQAGHDWRKAVQVQLRPVHQKTTTSVPLLDPIHTFEELRESLGQKLQTDLLRHFTTPTTVQSQAIPYLLAGRDCLVTAGTGQGKTIAFLVPILAHLLNHHHGGDTEPPHEKMGPVALVVAPTRELATQTQKVAHSVAPYIRSRAVIGGIGKYMLRQELKQKGGVDLVSATPGRLLDVVSDQKGLSLQRVTFTVLDEGDKMLQMGFEKQVQEILGHIAANGSQLCFCSATFPKRMEQVATRWLDASAVRIEVGQTGQSTQFVHQHCTILADTAAKYQFVGNLLPTLTGRTLIFVATRDGCEQLAAWLFQQPNGNTLRLATLHGDKHQSDRTAALRAFSTDKINILIATDVAGRGLDVPHVTTVIQLDAPKTVAIHVHRVGRAGRLSGDEIQWGDCHVLLTRRDADFGRQLLKLWESEGRPVPDDLRTFAQRRNFYGGSIPKRSRWS